MPSTDLNKNRESRGGCVVENLLACKRSRPGSITKIHRKKSFHIFKFNNNNFYINLVISK